MWYVKMIADVRNLRRIFLSFFGCKHTSIFYYSCFSYYKRIRYRPSLQTLLLSNKSLKMAHFKYLRNKMHFISCWRTKKRCVISNPGGEPIFLSL